MLTERDEEILRVLSLRVRVLSLAQISRTWFRSPSLSTRAASSCLQRLGDAGYLVRLKAFARPELELLVPLAVWTPGHPPPDYPTLSWKSALRWRMPAEQTTLFYASSRAAIRFAGVGGRPPRRSELSHDISLAGVYLRHYHAPEKPVRWISEGLLRRSGFGDDSRLPDAMVSEAGQSRAVELVGSYSSDKLSRFHTFCESEGFPYELW